MAWDGHLEEETQEAMAPRVGPQVHQEMVAQGGHLVQDGHLEEVALQGGRQTMVEEVHQEALQEAHDAHQEDHQVGVGDHQAGAPRHHHRQEVEVRHRRTGHQG